MDIFEVNKVIKVTSKEMKEHYVFEILITITIVKLLN